MPSRVLFTCLEILFVIALGLLKLIVCPFGYEWVDMQKNTVVYCFDNFRESKQIGAEQ